MKMQKINVKQWMITGMVGLAVFSAIGCQQNNNPATSNTAANQSNTTANTNQSNTTANANTIAAKSIKDELLGTWIQQESGAAKVKMVFTKDEYTKLDNDKKEDGGSYKWLNDEEIEMVFKGQKLPVKVTISGDEMRLVIQGMAGPPYKRESGNTAANANNQSAEKSPEIKAFENNLIGTWVNGSTKRVFTKDHLATYDNGKLNEYYPYRVVDKETVEMLGLGFSKDRIKITFTDNNSTFDWRWADRNGFNAKRESNNSDVVVGDSLFEKIVGRWVGISGTNSDKEKIAIANLGGKYKWLLLGSAGTDFTVQDNKTVVFQNGTQKTVSVDGNVMTVEDNGVTKKYNRQMTVD